MMFARSVVTTTRSTMTRTMRKKRSRTIIAPPTFAQSSAQFDPDYFLRPKVGQPGSVPARSRRREATGRRGAVAVAVAAAVCTPSSISNITAISWSRRAHGDGETGKSWRRKANVRASSSSTRRSRSTAIRRRARHHGPGRRCAHRAAGRPEVGERPWHSKQASSKSATRTPNVWSKT